MDRYKQGISIIIPCLNERHTIAQAVMASQKAIELTGLPGEVIVSDNGSSDGSDVIARENNAKVINTKKKGYGAALHKGICNAQYAYVVTVDADLAHPFEDIPILIQPLRENQAELVLGSRLKENSNDSAMPLLHRWIGTPALSLLIRLLYRIPVTDCNSGMRAFLNHRYMDLSLKCPGMEYASEMLIRASQKNLRYQEVPIKSQKDRRPGKPHLNPWSDGWRHLRFILGNGDAVFLILVPLIINFLLQSLALFLSFGKWWAPEEPIHYHTAFFAIAISMPLFIFVVSNVLIKEVLHTTGQVKSRVIELIEKFSEQHVLINFSLLFFSFFLIQSGYILYKCVLSGFSQLSELTGLIRMIGFLTTSVSLFSLDLGISIFKLLPDNDKTPDANDT